MQSANNWTTEECRENLLKSLLDVALQQEVRGLLDTKALPRRYLPPGKRADLYHLYLSAQMANNAEVASVATFYKAFRSSGWENLLRFRPRSQHSQCSTCHKLKSAIAHSTSFVEHARNCDKYHRHLAGMYADRKVYAALRARVSCQPTSQDHQILTGSFSMNVLAMFLGYYAIILMVTLSDCAWTL